MNTRRKYRNRSAKANATIQGATVNIYITNRVSQTGEVNSLNVLSPGAICQAEQQNGHPYTNGQSGSVDTLLLEKENAMLRAELNSLKELINK